MRRLMIVAAVLVAAVAALVLVRNDSGPSDDATAAFAEQTVSVGEIDISLQPHHVTGTGAEVKVVLDTHAVELDMDLVALATLEAGGRSWSAVAWSGDGPGGHHREGRLTFETRGSVAGPIVVRIDGFDGPVMATWDGER